jgi:endonuclease-3 related protein
MAKSKLLSPKALRQVPISRLAGVIRSSGYYNQKAKKLKALVGFTGTWTRENLLEVWGLGPETVDSILLYSRGEPYFVVDNYTRRILFRIGILPAIGTPYQPVQELFQAALEPDAMVYAEYHALLVELGKRHCRKKPVCPGCPLTGYCAGAGRTMAEVRTRPLRRY